MKILTSDSDDFLYDSLLNLLSQIKLVQGGTALASTLRRHSKVKNYLVFKQKYILEHFENKYFNDDGSLNHQQIEIHFKRSLQN